MENKKDITISPLNENAPSLQTQNGDKCILIYEDDLEILFLCKKLLSNLYRVVTLSRCENVINDINSIKPNLVLMDLWIPEIGGEKAISLLKENPDTNNIPVLLFSANAEIREICKKVNADGYIEKPFDINVFKETINKIINDNL